MAKYRLYANGDILHEDEFDLYDMAQPYYDDYAEYTIPDELILFIVAENT